MLVLENTIFTFNQFPANNAGDYDDPLDNTLMDDCTQNTQPTQPLILEKVDYDDSCPSPGILDSPVENNEGNSPVRRHRFSICKANDPQAIIAYRRLSNACSSIVPSPNVNQPSIPNTPYITPPPPFYDRIKKSSTEEQENVSPTLENSHYFNTSYLNLTIDTNNINTDHDNQLKEATSPFHTILTPNTFNAVLSPDQIIDNSRNLDDQFRLFNYVEDDDSDDGVSLPSVLNSNNCLNDFYNDSSITPLTSNIQFNSDNNIKNSEIVTSDQPETNESQLKNCDNDIKERSNNNEPTILNNLKSSQEELKIKSIDKVNEEMIKSYSQNVQGLYGLWKDNLNIGFKSILRG